MRRAIFVERILVVPALCKCTHKTIQGLAGANRIDGAERIRLLDPPLSWLLGRRRADDLLGRRLCDRHGTPPHPPPDQHRRLFDRTRVGYDFPGLMPTLLGGFGGLVIMLIFYFFGVLFARMRARRMRAQGMEVDDEEALGQGDVILVTILGFLVGWPLIWFLILVSTLLGGIVSFFLVIGLLISRRYNDNALMVFIPYGPYFIIGAALIVYFPGLLKALLPN